MKQFKIGKRTVGQGDIFLIAEIGNNHQGKVDLCCHMMEKAIECGADAVKLQKRNIETFWPEDVLNMPYINPDSFGKTYREHKKALEFDEKQWKKLLKFAKNRNILLFSTAFDEESVDFLEDLEIPAYKVASAGHTDEVLIKKIIDTGKPVIVSTGGGDWDDLLRLDSWFEEKKVYKSKYAYLHCTMEYPAPAEHMNLLVVSEMWNAYPKTMVGLSDHFVHSGDKGIMAYGAFMFGARIFEKHFTLNCGWKGPDHKASLEPEEFAAMRHGLERLRSALGDGVKRVYDEEKPNIFKMKKQRG